MYKTLYGMMGAIRLEQGQPTHAQRPRGAAARRRRHVGQADRVEPVGQQDEDPELTSAHRGRPRLANARRPHRCCPRGAALSAAGLDVHENRPQPDWAAIHREMKRPGVTLQLLWQEHRAQASEDYYRKW